MDKLSFDTFTKKIYIKAPKEKLYWCWGTTAGICSWFLRNATYTGKSGAVRDPEANIEIGDTYCWEWHNWDGKEEGTVLAADNDSLIAFSFAGVCQVSVTLEDKGKAVLVTLQQSNIPLDEDSKMNIYTGCSNGWTFWLANLKAFLEHGIQLNETEFDLTKEPLAGHIYVNM
ncbi:MAG: SRPBCC domain-containing protein [Eudoraea sp.]|nr:SRPBCC domain-containing protein [Eudoraea sp.]